MGRRRSGDIIPLDRAPCGLRSRPNDDEVIGQCDLIVERDADVRSRQKMHIRKGRELRILNFEFDEKRGDRSLLMIGVWKAVV
jgi:hypothetical protein